MIIDKEEKRTDAQNRALHLWCEQIADEYNNAGLDIEEVISNFTIDLFWTKESVKDLIIRTAITRMFGKRSTTQLSKQDEIDKVVDVVTRFNSKMGIGYIPFPSIEEIINNK